jgi:hypothetical protein
MSLMGFGLGGGYLAPFARFCDTFCSVLALVGRSGGLSDVAQKVPQEFGGLDDFSDVFFHGMRAPDDCFHCAPLGVNCPQSRADHFSELVFCFVGFRNGAEFGGLTTEVASRRINDDLHETLH